MAYQITPIEPKNDHENSMLTIWQWRKTNIERKQDHVNRALLHRLHEQRG